MLLWGLSAEGEAVSEPEIDEMRIEVADASGFKRALEDDGCWYNPHRLGVELGGERYKLLRAETDPHCLYIRRYREGEM